MKRMTAIALTVILLILIVPVSASAQGTYNERLGLGCYKTLTATGYETGATDFAFTSAEPAVVHIVSQEGASCRIEALKMPAHNPVEVRCTYRYPVGNGYKTGSIVYNITIFDNVSSVEPKYTLDVSTTVVYMDIPDGYVWISFDTGVPLNAENYIVPGLSYSSPIQLNKVGVAGNDQKLMYRVEAKKPGKYDVEFRLYRKLAASNVVVKARVYVVFYVTCSHTQWLAETTVEPTVDSEGVKTLTCKFCGEKKTVPIPRLTGIKIITNPKSVTVSEGKKATFTVETTNVTAYQWQYLVPGATDWTDVQKNGTSATYTLTAAARHSGNTYRCKLSNAAGSIYSGKATLTVITKPVITTQPKSVSVVSGKKATFTVAATGADSYLWQYQKPGDGKWTSVSKNGTSASYTLTTEARHNGYKYRCAVKNAAGTVYSNTVTLTVKVLPTITTQPKAVTVYVGKKATFKVVASDADSYKWQYQKPGETSWTNVSSNGTSATYTLTTAVKHNGYTYRCAVKNAAGTVYTDAVKLTVSKKPVITTQPKAVSVKAGKTATFKVVADGAAGYKWQYQKPGSSTWTDVSKNGASATYSLTTAAKHNGYKYRCQVKNDKGTVYTKAVTLTVK